MNPLTNEHNQGKLRGKVAQIPAVFMDRRCFVVMLLIVNIIIEFSSSGKTLAAGLRAE